MFFTQPPPPPSFGLFGPKPQSAFVSDTLAPLVGGPFTVRQMPFEERQAELPPEKRWPTLPGQILAGHMTPPDTVFVFDKSPHPEHTLMHESGHVWDARHVSPDVAVQIEDAMTRFKPKNKQEQYFASDPFEYIAETFARGLEHIRGKKTDLPAAEKDWPGITPMVEWMRTQPPFAPEAHK